MSVLLAVALRAQLPDLVREYLAEAHRAELVEYNEAKAEESLEEQLYRELREAEEKKP